MTSLFEGLITITFILIHLSHGTKFDPKSPKFKVSHSARGGGLNPNETLSHSNGKFVFDHAPNTSNLIVCLILLYATRKNIIGCLRN